MFTLNHGMKLKANRPALLAAGALWALVSCSAGVPTSGLPHVPDSGTLAVRCGRLIDGINDEIVTGATVLIEKGRITAVGKGISVPSGTQVLDLSTYTVLPGFIDMHTHIMEKPEDTVDLSVYFKITRDQQLGIGRRNAVTTLMAGFTSVRNVGAYHGFIAKDLRDEINRGEAIGPRMQVAGYYLTIPGGGGDLLVPGVPEEEIPADLRMGVSRGAEEFRRKAQAAIDSGADVLKVIASGAVLAYGGVPGQPEMTPEEIRAVTEVAHAAGRKVAAHAHGARSIKEAILAGADTIEHASLIDGEGVRLAKDHDVALSMDVYNGDYIDTEGRRQGWPQEFLDKNLATVEEQRKGFEMAYRAGTPIVYGTDSAVYPHGDNAKQFRIMIERGMKPMDAIRAATSVAARYMGWEDRVGGVQPGRYGDLIAVRGDPLQDVTVLESIGAVIKGGLVFKLPEDMQ
jgi:imidazolonepropionase-like amidohydrolase